MTPHATAAAIEGALSLGRFFVPRGSAEVVRRPTARMPWEVYRGHLLDAKQTRETAELAAWDFVLHGDEPCCDGPLVSILHDAATGRLHVTRNILVHGWETWEPASNVIESRPAEVWHRELVGTLDASDFADVNSLETALRDYVFLATIGTSRLPTTSLESPLPAYSLGRLAYFPGIQRPAKQPLRTGTEVLSATAALSAVEGAKALETLLRSHDISDVPVLADQWVDEMRSHADTAIGPPVCSPGANMRCVDLLRTVIEHVSLSSYTRFAENFAALLRRLAGDDLLGAEAVVDTIGYILRHLVRHLTAFDLVTFHNRGANYPDALFLDLLLRDYAALLARRPEFFLPPPGNDHLLARRRRRALRQAVLIRRQYEGHPVTEIPTSPGENLRVWPAKFARVPDDELQFAVKRRRRLYAGDALADRPTSPAWHAAMRQSLADLHRPDELRELGIATFLDRPLGVFKQPGEVDRTPLVSYQAFSREVAAERLGHFHRWGLLDAAVYAELQTLLAELPIAGIPAASFHLPRRPGVPALEDAQHAGGDFVFLATTRSSVNRLFFDEGAGEIVDANVEALDWLARAPVLLVIRTPSASAPQRPNDPLLIVYDEQLRPRLRLAAVEYAPTERYRMHLGVEQLRQGWRALPAES